MHKITEVDRTFFFKKMNGIITQIKCHNIVAISNLVLYFAQNRRTADCDL